MGTSFFCTAPDTTGTARPAAACCSRAAPACFPAVRLRTKKATAATTTAATMTRTILRSRIVRLLPAPQRAHQLGAGRGKVVVRLHRLRRGLGERHLRVAQLDGASHAHLVPLLGEP